MNLLLLICEYLFRNLFLFANHDAKTYGGFRQQESGRSLHVYTYGVFGKIFEIDQN